MKKYEVLSTCIIFSTKGDDGETKEYVLKKGETADLPENNIAIQALLARKQIKEIPSQTIIVEESIKIVETTQTPIVEESTKIRKTTRKIENSKK